MTRGECYMVNVHDPLRLDLDSSTPRLAPWCRSSIVTASQTHIIQHAHSTVDHLILPCGTCRGLRPIEDPCYASTTSYTVCTVLVRQAAFHCLCQFNDGRQNEKKMLVLPRSSSNDGEGHVWRDRMVGRTRFTWLTVNSTDDTVK